MGSRLTCANGGSCDPLKGAHTQGMQLSFAVALPFCVTPNLSEDAGRTLAGFMFTGHHHSQLLTNDGANRGQCRSLAIGAVFAPLCASAPGALLHPLPGGTGSL